MQRKYKILMFTAVCALAFVLVASAAAPAIGAWIDHSVVQFTVGTATSSFTTQVVGLYTNATITPLDINGNPYTGSTITNFNSGPISGNPSSPSVVAISASNFVPNDQAVFAVTITNTGSTTLTFQSYTLNDYFLTGAGAPITSGPWDTGVYAGVFALTNPWSDFNAAVNGGGALPQSQIVGCGSATAFADQMVDGSTYATTNNFNINWSMAWGSGTATPPATLAPAASYTYWVYIGLGVNVPYGIPNAYFSLDVQLSLST